MPDVVGWLLDPAHWQGPDGIPIRVLEHVAMAGAAVLVAILIGLPIGLWIGHTGRGATTAINVANIGRAIPSYALMGMILPVSLALSPDLGLWLIPTFLAMTALAIPPILVSTYAGLREVDRDLIEAARGMGLTERQILGRVEVPLAVPVIVGGIRTSTLQVIATATIMAWFSGPALGHYIYFGLLNQDYAQMAAGAVLVAVLAIGADLVLGAVQRVLTPRALRSGVRRPEPPDVPGLPPPTGGGAFVRAVAE